VDNKSRTWICLRALSHSFCPGAETVQTSMRWLMLSVTALSAKTSLHLTATTI